MISKINYAHRAFALQKNCCDPKKTKQINFNGGLASDMVEISNKNILPLEKVVNKAFAKLSEYNGQYLTTSKNVNIFLQTIKLGKQAKLTLSDGIFENGKSHVSFLLERSKGEKTKISSLDDSISENEASKYIQTYLSTLK